ncbi:ileal sodium/bile acid cotransporter-like [Ptychodera flava]|uniref:ileal sodium/bile acid cotransporter-like n=1 Tax=Ptychodera flava TaxID=63121 RepID=UPI003969D98B
MEFLNVTQDGGEVYGLVDADGMNNVSVSLAAGVLGNLSTALVNVTGNATDNETASDGFLSLTAYKRIKLTKRVTTIIITLSMMVAMGCVITVKETISHLRRPFGIFIGFMCQYGILPLTAFALCHAFRLEATYALGVLIMSCCPGGTTSNILTYWLNGDVSLSICMTTCSTVVAFGMMPLLLFIYTRSWTNESAVIPYTQIIITLVMILVPVVCGVLIRHKSKPTADKISRGLAIIAIIGIGMNLAFDAIMHSHVFTMHPELWAIGFILPTVGAVLSYAVSCVTRMPARQRRTVALETSLQNIGVAFTLIVLSFPADKGRIGAFITIYAALQSSSIYLLVPVGIFFSKKLGYSPVKDENEAGNKEEANGDIGHKADPEEPIIYSSLVKEHDNDLEKNNEEKTERLLNESNI